MKNISSTQKGFAHHLLIVSLVVIMAVGGAGYYVYSKQKKDSALAETALTEGNAGEFNPLDPTRILDTRDGTGGVSSAIAANSEVQLQVSGIAGVPTAENVNAGYFNFTVVSAGAKGYLTAYPAGQARPEVSVINFVANENRANTATLKLGSDGKITIFNGSSATVHVIVDVMGYYSSSTGPNGLRLEQYSSSTRILDTRNGIGASKAKVPANSTLTIEIPQSTGIDFSSAEAIYGTITAVNPEAKGYLTVYPSGTERSTTSILNFSAGQNTANSPIIKLGADKKFVIYNGSSAAVDLLFDTKGYFGSRGVTFFNGDLSGRFVPINPVRIVDTRKKLGLEGSMGYAGSLKRGQSDFVIAGMGGIPNDYLNSLNATVTIVNPSKSGWAELSPGLGTTSSINYPQKQNVAASIIMKADSYSTNGGKKTSRITLPADAALSTDVLVDVYGYYYTTVK